MRKVISFVLVCLFVVVSHLLLFPVFSLAQEEGLEYLLFEEIPTVITASKKAESIVEAPSIMYVISRNQIERSGAATLAEIITRVPGMSSGLRESSLIGSRGLMSDQNDKFVFVIDGVPIRNINQDGSYNYADIPNLDMVDHIEVVKGPSSTLWGSDASFGVIHLITKQGVDINGLQSTLNYSSEDARKVANVLYGKETTDGDLFLSLTLTEADGFAQKGKNGNDYYLWGNESDVRNPSLNLSGEGIKFVDTSPSYELYAKVTMGDISIKARTSRMFNTYLWMTDENRTNESGMRYSNIAIEQIKELSDLSSLTTKLDIHSLTYERGVPEYFNGIITTTFPDLETMRENGAVFDMLYQTTLAEKHNIQAGFKIESIEFGPTTRREFDPATGNAIATADQGFTQYIVLEKDVDNTYGIYVEDNFKATDIFTLVAGVSYEYNDLREKEGKVLPRVAAIYELSDTFSLKYTYTTGYNRPPAMKKFGRQFGFVEKSEDVSEHDIQLMYSGEKVRFSIVLFKYKIEEFFTWGGSANSATDGHINFGDAESNGVEADISYSISDSLLVYGNMSYQKAEINETKILGSPKYLYNLGLDWVLTDKIVTNLNINGYKDMYYGIEGKYWSGEAALDLTVIFKEVLYTSCDVSVYGKNVLDEDIHTTMTSWPGYTYARGATFGVKVSNKF